MVRTRETEVLVVGAGPVGLMAALGLAGSGADVTVVDKDWRASLHSYALALHPATLALLAERGLVDELVAQGLRVDRMALYDGETRAGEMDFSKLDSRFPFVLIVPQSDLERAIERRLGDHGVKVFWNHQVMSLEPTADGAVAEVARMEKVSLGYPVAHTEWVVDKSFRFKSSFVVGADGYDSLIRRKLGVDYAKVGPTDSFNVFEFPHEHEGEREPSVVIREEAVSVLWPLPEGRSRWSFQIARPAARKPDLRALHGLLQERAPWFAPIPERLHWTTTAWFERRLAEPFGRDRVWLAGDAAHLTGPVGVQSMNVGLKEGADLAGRLAQVLREPDRADLLDDYANERRREWRRLLGLGGEATALPGAPDWGVRHASRIPGCVPASGSDLGALLGQIGLRLPEEGDGTVI